jgi:hypothetical protein
MAKLGAVLYYQNAIPCKVLCDAMAHRVALMISDVAKDTRANNHVKSHAEIERSDIGDPGLHIVQGRQVLFGESQRLQRYVECDDLSKYCASVAERTPTLHAASSAAW